MTHLLYSLPHDIQYVIWRIYFINIIIFEMKQCKQKSFIRDNLDTRTYLEVTRGY